MIGAYFAQHGAPVASVPASSVNVSVGGTVPDNVALFPPPYDLVSQISDPDFSYFVWGQNLVIVDTQPVEYFTEAHIPGAVNLPYADRIKTPVNLPRNKTLLLYCPCEHEEESTEMATKLEKLGYTKLKLLQGGFPRWQQLKYPTSK